MLLCYYVCHGDSCLCNRIHLFLILKVILLVNYQHFHRFFILLIYELFVDFIILSLRICLDRIWNKILAVILKLKYFFEVDHFDLVFSKKVLFRYQIGWNQLLQNYVCLVELIQLVMNLKVSLLYFLHLFILAHFQDFFYHFWGSGFWSYQMNQLSLRFPFKLWWYVNMLRI